MVVAGLPLCQFRLGHRLAGLLIWRVYADRMFHILGLAMGAWIAGGISGGHLNPAVYIFPIPDDFIYLYAI